MDDTDLIAWVYPFEDDKYRYAQAAIDNAAIEEDASSRYRPPKVARQETPKIRFSRSARESTEPPERSKNEDPDELPYLELRFSDVPRTSSGLVIGTGHTCDILLPSKLGISKRHFAPTYQERLRGRTSPPHRTRPRL